MDTNSVAEIVAEVIKRMPVAKTGISDATWRILFDGLIAISLAWIAWKSHKIEKDVNSTASALAKEKEGTVIKILELSKENAAMKEQLRSVSPTTVQSVPNPSVVASAIPNPIPLPLPITIVPPETK